MGPSMFPQKVRHAKLAIAPFISFYLPSLSSCPTFLSFCPFSSVSFSLFIVLSYFSSFHSFFLSLFIFYYLFIYLSIYLFIYLFIHLFIYLLIYLLIILFIHNLTSFALHSFPKSLFQLLSSSYASSLYPALYFYYCVTSYDII